MRQHWITAIGLTLALLSLAALPADAAADETCASGHVCVWVENHFKGAKGESLCTGGVHPLAGLKESGKNRCANKAVWFRNEGVATSCLNPNENNAGFPFLINELWVGAEGSRCP